MNDFNSAATELSASGLETESEFCPIATECTDKSSNTTTAILTVCGKLTVGFRFITGLLFFNVVIPCGLADMTR
ncbi:MAG: hypothetical protein HOF72_01130 [Planctomycetaceae bacterium]|nr:hypothetical protein [Planctomycetaceae bacterium]MBT5126205.1 hypothetical protein [Planctomycetaceae bacterium]